jgi:hypothetical protein
MQYQHKAFNGNALFSQFTSKGWWVVRNSESRYITLTPPPKYQAHHYVRILVPVVEPMTLDVDPSRPFEGIVMANGTSRTKHCGPVFEVKADWNDAQKWTAFAVWVNELVQNPDKFYHGS